MKVIFLDHDGVVCLAHNWGSRFKKGKGSIARTVADATIPVCDRFDDLDPTAVSVLNEIIEITGAELVVSSDWRNWANLEELGQFYLAQGIVKAPISVTPLIKELDDTDHKLLTYRRNFERIRIIEIRKWLSDNPVDAWVAVDDLNMRPKRNGGDGLTSFVLTPNSKKGIAAPGIKEAIIRCLMEPDSAEEGNS